MGQKNQGGRQLEESPRQRREPAQGHGAETGPNELEKLEGHCSSLLGLPCQSAANQGAGHTETDSHPVLEAGGLRSKCRQSRASSGGPGGGSLLASSSFRELPAILGLSWFTDTSFQSPSVIMWPSSRSSYKDSRFCIRAHLNPIGPHLG